MVTKGARSKLIREDVLRKAAVVFSEKGFASATLQDIADAVGLSRPALYYYFKNKDQVLIALADEATTFPVTILEKHRREKLICASERLRAAMHELVTWMLQSPYLIRLLESNEAKLPAEVSEQHTKAKRRVLRTFVDMVTDGISSGEFHHCDPRLAAFALLGMCNWTAWWYRPEGEAGPAEVAKAYADIAVRALQVKEARPREGDNVQAAMQTLKNDIEYLERVIQFRVTSKA